MLSCLIATLLCQQLSTPVYGLEASGEIVVEYREEVDDRKRRSFERAVGLPVKHGYKALSSDGRVRGHSFRYQVPSSQENFWVHFLNQNSLIKKAEGPPGSVATNGADLTANVEFVRQSGRFMVASFTLIDTKHLVSRKLQEFFNSMYLGKNGRLRVLGKGKYFLHFQVDYLRGEVIRDRKFWEQIEIYIVSIPAGVDAVEIHEFLDGKYAAGLGDNPPGELAFSSMEPDFFQQENDYLSAITALFLDYIVRNSAYTARWKGEKSP
jgi:hypothetical protein